jgi:hypothetical protein
MKTIPVLPIHRCDSFMFRFISDLVYYLSFYVIHTYILCPSALDLLIFFYANTLLLKKIFQCNKRKWNSLFSFFSKEIRQTSEAIRDYCQQSDVTPSSSSGVESGHDDGSSRDSSPSGAPSPSPPPPAYPPREAWPEETAMPSCDTPIKRSFQFKNVTIQLPAIWTILSRVWGAAAIFKFINHVQQPRAAVAIFQLSFCFLFLDYCTWVETLSAVVRKTL